MRRGLFATLLVSATVLASCGGSGTRTGGGPTAYNAAIAQSTTDSGVNRLPAGNALQLGNGICTAFGQGLTPAEIVTDAYELTNQEISAAEMSELMNDSTQFLCPKYFSTWKQFATSATTDSPPSR